MLIRVREGHVEMNLLKWGGNLQGDILIWDDASHISAAIKATTNAQSDGCLFQALAGY